MSPSRGAKFIYKKLAAELLFHIITNSDNSTFGVKMNGTEKFDVAVFLQNSLAYGDIPTVFFPDCRQSLKASVWIIVSNNRCNSCTRIIVGA